MRLKTHDRSRRDWLVLRSGRAGRSALIAGLTACVLAVTTAAPAHASSESDPEAVADAVASAAPTPLHAVPLEENGDALAATIDGGVSVVAGIDPEDGLTLTKDDGSSLVTVSLPGATALGEADVTDDGSVTFMGDAAVPSVSILAAADAVRISTVIDSSAQTESFTYDFGSEATVELQDDGGALVVTAGPDEATETIVADIDAPWAADATGSPVDTFYVADGGTLTQVVEHRAQGLVYPVVADPSFDQPNIFQYRVRFNRAETRTIAQYGLASLGGAACGAPMALACMFAAGAVAYNAGVAENSNPKRCVQITATNTFSPANIIWWVDTYRGGPCR